MIYAVGDIHGQKSQLDRALALIEADGGPDARIVFIGDYVDRGPDSRGVLQTLITGQAQGRNWVMIKGNHDRNFARYVRNGVQHDVRIKSGLSWLHDRLGGLKTLASYGVAEGYDGEFQSDVDRLDHLTRAVKGDRFIEPDDLHAAAQDAVPEDHLRFIETLPLTHEESGLLFVHAGIKPGVALADQDPEDLLWIRDGWLEDQRDHGPLVVHGHTALDHPQHYGNRVNLDGGAGYGNPLVPAVFDGRDCWLLTPSGRVPLTFKE